MRVPRISAWWFLALAWAVNMFWMSTESFGVEQTRPLLARLLDLLHIHLSAAAFGVLHTATRKLAHGVEYAVLALFLYRCFQSRARCLLVCAAYSLTDELHQVFVRGRGPSLFDCAIDMAGAAIGLLVVSSLVGQAFSLPVKLGGAGQLWPAKSPR